MASWPVLAGTLLLVLGGAFVGGCVLPIAPEFEEERNLAPFVVEARPGVGTVVTDLNARFGVTVEDPNKNDTLFVRWLIDYPPFSPEITRTALSAALPSRGPAEDNRHTISFQPSCMLHALSPTLTRHQLLVVISDRPFLDAPPDANPATRRLDDIPIGAFAVRLSWAFDKLPCL